MTPQYRACYACIQFAVLALCCLSTHAHAEAGSAVKPGGLMQQRPYYRSEVFDMGFFEKKQPSKFKLQAPEYYFPERATQNLLKAALAGDVETSTNLVAAGADPNARGTTKPGGTFGFSPLHYAIAANSAQGTVYWLPSARILSYLQRRWARPCSLQSSSTTKNYCPSSWS
jgi:hypothetical protein